MNQIKSLEHFLHVVILDKFYLIVMGLFAMCVCGGGGDVFSWHLEFSFQKCLLFYSVCNRLEQTVFPAPNVNRSLIGKHRTMSYNVGCVTFNHYQIL